MQAIRHWTVRHARAFEWLYRHFEPLLLQLAPLMRRLGYQRLERPVAAVERTVKGVLFDCQMCGHCVLSDTGMACPMNCPKQLRNGPCGGVRANGHCEVKPEMRCVWVEAWEGSTRMRRGDRIHLVQAPVDARAKGQSSWLAVAQRQAKPGAAHEV
ncbi:MAG: methylenetetrahydrofolate reductase C-terminal domain-containing protein [Saccharospirillum sp.]